MKIAIRSNVRDWLGSSMTRPRYQSGERSEIPRTRHQVVRIKTASMAGAILIIINGNKKSRSQTGSVPLKAKCVAVPCFTDFTIGRPWWEDKNRGPLRRTENQGSGYCNQRPDNQNTLK
jgi:hypothetical protein